VIIYKYKKFFLKIEHVHFSKDFIFSNADIIYYFQCQKKHPNSSLFKSPVIYLNSDIDLIKNSFRSSIRQEVNQIEKKKLITSKYFYKPKKEVIYKFIKFYDHYASVRNLPLADSKKLIALKENILITCALAFENIIIYHVYLFDEIKVRLWYSATKPNAIGDDLQFVAKVNKFLHYEDIRLAKQLDFVIYDLGGINLSGSDKVKSISQFKLGFTKNIEETNNFIMANSFVGDIALKVKKFFL
jgi:hypothetical protein